MIRGICFASTKTSRPRKTQRGRAIQAIHGFDTTVPPGILHQGARAFDGGSAVGKKFLMAKGRGGQMGGLSILRRF